MDRQKIEIRKKNIDDRVQEIQVLANDILESKKLNPNAYVKEHTEQLTDLFNRYFINTVIDTPYENTEPYLDFEIEHYKQMSIAEIDFSELNNADDEFGISIGILKNMKYVRQMRQSDYVTFSYNPISMN